MSITTIISSIILALDARVHLKSPVTFTNFARVLIHPLFILILILRATIITVLFIIMATFSLAQVIFFGVLFDYCFIMILAFIILGHRLCFFFFNLHLF